MASYHRVALFIFFDAIERDLVDRIRLIGASSGQPILIDDEKTKASTRLQRRDNPLANSTDEFDLLFGLDLGDKLAILMRHRKSMDQGAIEYFTSKRNGLERAIPVRNAVMHGRPLTTDEYAIGFSLANDLLKTPLYWPSLSKTYGEFSDDPTPFVTASINFLDETPTGEVLNNLPVPDYDDTGFFPRPALETDLRKKLMGRHPVVTVLGEGGNGKSALALQTLYGLVASNDHDFDAIVWVSAKATKLSTAEITRIEGAISSSLGLFEEIALLEPGEEDPMTRVRRLLTDNKVLLAIDNLETVLDPSIQAFAAEVPGDSKLLFTSRVPLGSDLHVTVDTFTATEARAFIQRLIDAYDIDALRKMKSSVLSRHLERLEYKPLLIKWFALGVQSGLPAERITSQPELALRFCMENVIDRLGPESKRLIAILASIPRPVSASVLQYLTEEGASKVEIALAELTQFSLIDSSVSAFELAYQLKPFAKAYLTKVLRASSDNAAAIAARYRTLEGTYQAEQGRARSSRYDPRTFIVRSRSEAVAAGKLRHATSLALKERFDSAFKLLEELKIVAPTYFEVHRVEAFVSFRAGDNTRAINAFEAAIELDPDQPQLHALFAGFLMRSYSDYTAAQDEFEKALAIDSNAGPVLREAARNSFFLYDFDRAEKLITRSWDVPRTTYKDEVVLNDLQAQLFIRKADFLQMRGDPMAAVEAIERLEEFLDRLDKTLIDTTFIAHLSKIIPTISNLRGNPRIEDIAYLNKVDDKIRTILGTSVPRLALYQPRLIEDIDEVRTGTLKVEGRRENFGFIVDLWGHETFVARSEVEDIVWHDMCNGRIVSFQKYMDTSGRPRASKVTLA